MRLTYRPDEDLLSITLGDRSAVPNRAARHVSLDFDASGEVITIRVARASEFIDLTSLDVTGLPVAEAPAARRHTVQPGDTLSAIAAASGVSVEALIAANDLDDPDLIAVGQVLRIPIG